MGQVASSKRRHNWISSGNTNKSSKRLKQSKQPRRYPLEVWRQIKDAEINQLQGKTRETENELERVKKQFACQSFLLKEIFEDRLREERKNQMTEMQKMSNEIEILKKELINMKRKRK